MTIPQRPSVELRHCPNAPHPCACTGACLKPKEQKKPKRHAHVYERLSLCCSAPRADSNMALYDAALEPVCRACGTLTTMVSICWCGKVEEAE